jgi:sec-independent protein translocase protein TatA
MFDIGGSEWVILLLIVLVIFGGSRLPGLFKALGQGVKEFREASKDDGTEVKIEPDKRTAASAGPEAGDKPSA